MSLQPQPTGGGGGQDFHTVYQAVQAAGGDILSQLQQSWNTDQGFSPPSSSYFSAPDSYASAFAIEHAADLYIDGIGEKALNDLYLATGRRLSAAQSREFRLQIASWRSRFKEAAPQYWQQRMSWLNTASTGVPGDPGYDEPTPPSAGGGSSSSSSSSAAPTLDPSDPVHSIISGLPVGNLTGTSIDYEDDERRAIYDRARLEEQEGRPARKKRKRRRHLRGIARAVASKPYVSKPQSVYRFVPGYRARRASRRKVYLHKFTDFRQQAAFHAGQAAEDRRLARVADRRAFDRQVLYNRNRVYPTVGQRYTYPERGTVYSTPSADRISRHFTPRAPRKLAFVHRPGPFAAARALFLGKKYGAKWRSYRRARAGRRRKRKGWLTRGPVKIKGRSYQFKRGYSFRNKFAHL